jgi:hypothetical protein
MRLVRAGINPLSRKRYPPSGSYPIVGAAHRALRQWLGGDDAVPAAAAVAVYPMTAERRVGGIEPRSGRMRADGRFVRMRLRHTARPPLDRLVRAFGLGHPALDALDPMRVARMVAEELRRLVALRGP